MKSKLAQFSLVQVVVHSFRNERKVGNCIVYNWIFQHYSRKMVWPAGRNDAKTKIIASAKLIERDLARPRKENSWTMINWAMVDDWVNQLFEIAIVSKRRSRGKVRNVTSRRESRLRLRKLEVSNSENQINVRLSFQKVWTWRDWPNAVSSSEHRSEGGNSISWRS